MQTSLIRGWIVLILLVSGIVWTFWPHYPDTEGCFIDQPENERANAASIYPHPVPPGKLHSYGVHLTVVLAWQPFMLVQFDQARPKGGWWHSKSCYIPKNGRINTEIEADPDWGKEMLITIMNTKHQQVWAGMQSLPIQKEIRLL